MIQLLFVDGNVANPTMFMSIGLICLYSTI